MASITNAVRGSLAVQDAVAKSPNFGSIALFAYTTLFTGFREYACDPDGLSAMIEDGFSTDDTAYKIVGSMTSGGTATVKIFARTTAPTQSYKVTPESVREGFAYRLTVKGTQVEYVAESGDTIADICTGLQTALDAIDGVTATDNQTDVDVEADEGTSLDLEDVSRLLHISDESEAADIATDLAQAAVDDPDFLCVLLDTTCSADISAAATWCSQNRRLLIAECPDSDIVDASSETDIAYLLNSADNHFAMVVATHQIASHPGARLASRQMAIDPGESTAAYKNVGGKADSWTQSQIAAAKAKAATLYIPLGGVNNIYKGHMASDRPMDLQRDILYLETTMALAVLTVLQTSEKVRYTTTGVSQILAAMEGVLGALEGSMLVSGESVVVGPVFEEITVNDKVQRVLKGVRYSAVVAGAIEEVEYRGTLTF